MIFIQEQPDLAFRTDCGFLAWKIMLGETTHDILLFLFPFNLCFFKDFIYDLDLTLFKKVNSLIRHAGDFSQQQNLILLLSLIGWRHA